MSRSTFSGPLNVGRKAKVTGITGITKIIGTAVVAAKVSHDGAATNVGVGANVRYTIVLPKFSKLLRVSTVNNTMTAGTVTMKVGSSAGGQEYVTGVTVGNAAAVASRTLLAVAVAALSNASADTIVHVELAVATTAWTAGVVDVIFEYLTFADDKQNIAPLKD